MIVHTYPTQKNVNAKFYLHEAEIIEAGLPFKTAPQLSVDTVSKSASNSRISNSDENVKKSLDVDSDGNKLSAEQQEYFADSKIRDEDGIYMAVDPAFGGGDFVSSPVGVQYGEDIYIPDVVFDNRDKQFTQPALARLAIRNAVKRMQIEANKSTEAYKEGVQTEVKKQGERITITSKAAPAELNGEVVDIGVAVIIGRKNRVHSVRVLTPQGNEFELIKNNDAEPLTNVGGTTKSGVSTTIGSASINNISQNPKKNNTKKSLDVDTDGNTLTEAQQEYFKDSKVRDENGRLKVMYHGTPNATYNAFRAGTYFTENEEYAGTYQYPGASSISVKSTAENPDTYAVYANK